MELKEEFKSIALNNIKRDGITELLNYIEKSDFYTAPASSRYHCAYKGGLLEHSLNVYKRLLKIVSGEYGENWQEKVSLETLTICSLFHDLCKIDYYKEDLRNVKENGVWIQKPYYSKNELLPYGHGEKSVYILNGFIRLSREEAISINWHMGGFDTRVKGGDQSVSDAYCKYPLAVLLHVADLQATFIDEKRD